MILTSQFIFTNITNLHNLYKNTKSELTKAIPMCGLKAYGWVERHLQPLLIKH